MGQAQAAATVIAGVQRYHRPRHRDARQDGNWLGHVVTEMDQEDGLIWGYDPGDESVVAFTDFGVETLTGLIEIYKADVDLLQRSTGPK